MATNYQRPITPKEAARALLFGNGLVDDIAETLHLSKKVSQNPHYNQSPVKSPLGFTLLPSVHNKYDSPIVGQR